MSAVLDAPEAPAVCGANTGWRQLRLGHVAEFRGGMTPSKDERRYWDGDIPWVSAKDMKRPDISDSQDHVTTAALKETALSLVQPGAILIVVRGMILAHTLPVAMVRAPLTINQDMKALVTRPGVQPEFLAWWLRGLSGRLLIEATDEAAHGTKAIRLDRLRAFPVALPATGEQRAIVAFLDRETAKLDALIAKKERLIALERERQQAAAAEIVARTSVDASEWRLSHVCEVVTSGSRGWAEYYADEGSVFLRIGNLSQNSLALRLDESDIQFVQPPSNAEGERTRVRPNDVLISITALIGAVGVVPADWAADAFVNQHLALVRPRRGIIDSRWLGYALLSPIGRVQFDTLLYGGTKQGLGLDDVRSLRIPVPPMQSQHAAVAEMDRVQHQSSQLIARVNVAVERLREYRAALITAAVTGQLDVRGRVPELEPAA